MPKKTHGATVIRDKTNPLYATYRAWRSMRLRCENPKDTGYQRYGGRGIRVCARWQRSFEAFVADVGIKPAGHTLDRIDPNGHYEPGNVRWATRKVQTVNRTNTRWLTWAGRTRTLQEWADETGVGYSTLNYRLRRGWDVGRALTTPAARVGLGA